MDAVFLKLLNMSVSAGWMVVAVIVLRLCLKKAPKAIHCALWALVAVRLLCPFSLESSFSLIPKNLANGSIISEWADDYVGSVHMFHDNTAQYHTAVAAGRAPVYSGEGHYYVVTAPDQLGAPATVENTVVPVLSRIWLAGVAALLLYAAISCLRIRSRTKVSLSLKDNIWLSDQVDSPFILGIIRPKIYLPFDMEEWQIPLVVSHEQAHLSRRDHWWKPFGFLLLAVYWFHPLMWLAYILLCRDMELACDEKVIRDMSAQDKKIYSEALLTCSVPRRMMAACPLAFGEVGVKERVKSVMNYRKPAFWVIAVSVIACAVAAICFLTNPAEDDTPNHMEERYYLLVGADGVHEIQISLPDSGGGVVSADGSFFKKGEKAYLEPLQGITDLRGLSITALGKNGEVIYALSIPEGASDAEIINIVASDGWLLAPTGFTEITASGKNIWSRRETCDPVEMLAYLCQLDLWGSSINEEPQISVPGNFGPHASFSDTPNDADALDVAMARRAFLLMRLYPEEVSYVTWSYPDADGNDIRKEFFANEMSGILALSSHTQNYELPASVEDVDRLIQFLTIDKKLFLRYAAEGNDFSPLLEAQENAVWFAPEDIHDIEYMELVWHDGQRFTPLTGEGYDYIQTRFSSAKEIGTTGCPYHSVLYIHRSDGVVGKVMPAEDSCDIFLSGGKYYQFGDRAQPPYYDSNETFYNHFGTSVSELPHYISTPDPTEPEGIEQYEFTDILGYNGYVISDGGSSHKVRSYYAVVGNQRWLIAETFGFGEAQDYVVDLDGDGVTELVANVTYGGDGARRAYIYQRRGNEIYLGTLSAKGLPNFNNWGVNATWSEYEPSTGIFRLHYAQKDSENYAVFETKELARFQFDVFSPAPPVVTNLTAKEIEDFNNRFTPILYDQQRSPVGINPVSCFFTSYYDDVRGLDFDEFMRYFPGDGSSVSDAEFSALKELETFPFYGEVSTMADMSIPVNRYPARLVNLTLTEYAGITTDDLDTSGVEYLPEYEAYYNYTSDFGPGMFTCTRGERVGDTVYLYEELEQGTDLLVVQGDSVSFRILSHQRLEGNNAVARRYG